ncbi:phytoene desaturase family protein [Corynebacterium pacaense]|uniref:phytoene desaturase family protein n=1 Tax=Corynebacterium pacaense TaxID=1816684 RepID=UPI0009BC43DA|nr:NAD(P)/FAD-dependent oxidoreductase [Corynebacterium pacaense]
MSRRAAIVGSGPNGLTAAALLARAGWEVDVYEQADVPGGAGRSSDVLGPGTIVDLGAAGHPFGIASPAFRELDLAAHGLEWRHSRYPMAHPLDNGEVALLHRGVGDTARGLGGDGRAWRLLHADLTRQVDLHLDNLLGPVLRVPPHPLALLAFGPRALPPARALATAAFRGERARVLFTGSAVHAMAAPSTPMTSAFGLLFGALGMSRGWPVAAGGTRSVVAALEGALTAHGGRIHTGHEVGDLRELSGADAVIVNMTPRQVLGLGGLDAVPRSMWSWRYGPGAHKLDILLDGPVPWDNPAVSDATTVHVCGSTAEIDTAERQAVAGTVPERPFVLLCQQQVADPSRSADPREHVVWAYAHVPAGSADPRVRDRIIAQIERFAPGFTSRIIRVVEHTPRDLERWDPNLVGGDVAGGATTGIQAVRRMPVRLGGNLYMASASSAPGGGVHGMPGYWAARAVLQDAAGWGGPRLGPPRRNRLH